MLRSLSIKDFVIVDRLELEFAAGFSVLTGETGAGKSILVDALSLALGERAEAGVIRAGCERAEIAAEFDIAGLPQLQAWLAENELAGDEPSACLLRRTVHADGRSRGFINGSSATMQQLREAGDFLVDIYSQNVHHSLLKTTAQRELLDAYGGLSMLAGQVAAAGSLRPACRWAVPVARAPQELDQARHLQPPALRDLAQYPDRREASWWFFDSGKVNGQVADGFPVPVTAELVNRGHQRYDIYCSECHSRTGDGNGMIPSRGYRRPPSFHTEILRQRPTGHYFDVMTNGFGAMPPYGKMIPPHDRWAIVAYIRALQLSQNATIADVPLPERAKLFDGGRASSPPPSGFLPGGTRAAGETPAAGGRDAHPPTNGGGH